MESNDQVDLRKRSATYLEKQENLLNRFGESITRTDKGMEVTDRWEGEDGYVSKKLEGFRHVKERWDQDENEEKDSYMKADFKTPNPSENVRDMECQQRDLIKVEESMKEADILRKLKQKNEKKNMKEEEKQMNIKLEELRNLVLSKRVHTKRKRKRRPYVNKAEKTGEQLAQVENSQGEINELPNSIATKKPMQQEKTPSKNEVNFRNSLEERHVCVEDVDLRNTGEPYNSGEESGNGESEPKSDYHDNKGCIKSDGKVKENWWIETRTTKTAADVDDNADDEEEEDDDDEFLPRKLFLFSFSSFKDEDPHKGPRA